MLNTWRCNTCQEIFTFLNLSETSRNSFRCNTCNYDICQRCVNRNASQNSVERKFETLASTIKQKSETSASIIKQKSPSETLTLTNYKSLFIGINYVGTPYELSGCINDVYRIRDTIVHKNFDITNSIVLVDNTTVDAHLMPTKSNIISSLKWLVKDARAGDVMFFHYSGHGMKRDGEDRIISLGFEEITASEIFDIVKTLPEGCRLTAITDCCHSGNVFNLEHHWRWNGEEQDILYRKKSRKFETNASQDLDSIKFVKLITEASGASGRSREFETITNNICGADIIVLSACRDDQTAADSSGSASRGGACTTAFTELVNSNTSFTYMEMLYHFQESIASKGFEQIPQMTTTKLIDMNTVFDFTTIKSD